jgi:hypothetical protein
MRTTRASAPLRLADRFHGATEVPHPRRELPCATGRWPETPQGHRSALRRDCHTARHGAGLHRRRAGSAAAADIVFDRFHVMHMFNKVIRDCRRAEFKAAKTLGDLTGQQTIKGSLWLLLSNRATLKQTDQERLAQLLAQNQSLDSLYALKEQLQRLWQPNSTPAEMTQRLDDWCGMAKAANIAGLNKFVKTLQSHRSGICAYADHPITTSRLEAGNVSIALLRHRARGFRDMEYFKLKIFQFNTEDTPSFIYSTMPTASRLTPVSTVGKP